MDINHQSLGLANGLLEQEPSHPHQAQCAVESEVALTGAGEVVGLTCSEAREAFHGLFAGLDERLANEAIVRQAEAAGLVTVKRHES